MEVKAIFGIFSAVFTLIGAYYYLRSIHKKESNPHLLSWVGWTFITTIGAFAMLDSGSTWATIFIFANSASSMSVVLYSMYKKVGIWSTTIYDYIFFSLGILGIILWQLLNMPLVAIILSVLADLLFAIPTVIKVYRNPRSESANGWIPYCIAGIFGLLAIRSISLTETLYPFYIFFINFLILIIILFKKNKIKNAEINKN